MTSNVPYKGQAGEANQLSPAVWANIPLRNCLDLTGGCGQLAKSLNIGTAAAGVIDVASGGDLICAEGSSTTAINAAEFGTKFTPQAAGHFVLGGMEPQIDISAATRWACEISLENATAANHGMFFGLVSFADAGAAITTTGNVIHKTTSALVTTQSQVGFYKLEGAATVEAILKKDGVAAVDRVVHSDDCDTLVATEFSKWGMNSDGRNIRFYVDGVQTGLDLPIDNTGLPAESDLVFVFAFTADNTTAFTIKHYAYAEAK
tara:strand:+ start:8065 stop:8850 length:786 start_codon:yes stop_codon:yes gene_type:complete